MSDSVRGVEASRFDMGTTSIRLFISSLEAEHLYKELAERYKRAEERLRGD